MKVEMSLMNRSLQDVGAEARRAEALGYDGVTTGETSADPFFKLVLAAEHTERVTLGTSVLIAFPRSPMVVAYQAWDLQAFSHGRLNLGLGTQVGAHIRRRFSGTWDSPGPRLREYIGALRAIWECWRDGVKLNFRGDFYQFTLMTPYFTPAQIEHPHIPVYISAINPYNCRLAGELCDGIRMHGFNTPRYAQRVIIPNLEEGARKAGRTLEEIDIVGTGFTITGPDEQSLEAKFPAVKKQIAFYASTPAYRPVMDIHGWGEEHLELHRMSREGKWDEMGNLISDEMLDAFTTVGTYDEIAGKIKARWGGISTRSGFALPEGQSGDDERLRDIVSELKS